MNLNICPLSKKERKKGEGAQGGLASARLVLRAYALI